MFVTFTLGLMGSLGHCVGMCSGVMLLLKRHPALQQSRVGWVLAHLGRMTSYMLLGGLVGYAAHRVGLHLGSLKQVQGAFSFLMAAAALYFALAIIGYAPAPDRAMGGLIQKWGQAMRQATSLSQSDQESQPGKLAAYGLGLLWGLLPCGLVLSALFTAAAVPATTSNLSLPAPLLGAAYMLAFGVGTLPALVGLSWLASAQFIRRWTATWPRYAAAAAMLLIGVQFSFRGLAAWGVVDHLVFQGMMLW